MQNSLRFLNNLSYVLPVTDRREIIRKLKELIEEAQADKHQSDIEIWSYYNAVSPTLNSGSKIKAIIDNTIKEVLEGI